jgi:LPPG:FO 2-phospho-L-lactate transferase
LSPDKYTIIGNTGDDFIHLGLTISPDLDTLLYTLGHVANAETGWGRQGESWQVLNEISRFNSPDWFRLGDKDLALHLTRTHMLHEGHSLTVVTRHLSHSFQIEPELLPMTNQPAPTYIQTEEERLPFQTWFVQKKWQPVVQKVVLPEDVRATSQVTQRLEKADIIIIAPSNPFVSIDPILNVYPIREMVMDLPQAVVAVTPIIGSHAVKGPAAKMMQELGLHVSATAVATYYGALIDGFVYDASDPQPVDLPGKATFSTNTLMKSSADRRQVAEDVLAFAEQIINS